MPYPPHVNIDSDRAPWNDTRPTCDECGERIGVPDDHAAACLLGDHDASQLIEAQAIRSPEDKMEFDRETRALHR